ncbi:MAG: hypothetical protein CFH01_01791, partial [Alphaproteobacteria bacterium MarineAlpha2_Bin1]
IIMSASNKESAESAAKNRATMGLALIPDLKSAKELIEIYMETAVKSGWQPTSENVLVGLNTCISEDSNQAVNELSKGTAYFGKVLMGGPRTAQKIVLQKSRYFSSEDVNKVFMNRLNIVKQRSVTESIDAGVILCGNPYEIIEQIKNVQSELECGWINMNMKVGNIPNESVIRSMKLFKEYIRPAFPSDSQNNIAKQAAE